MKKVLNVHLPFELHKELKVCAAQSGTGMSVLVREAITSYLKQKKEEAGQ